MKLDILVVSYHARKELAQTLSSIALFSAPGYRLTVHDNTSKNYPLTWLWNRFTERSKREAIALVNSDVVVGPGWDTEALEFLESDLSVANVSPLSNYPPHATFAHIPHPDWNAIEWIPEFTKTLKERKRFELVGHHSLISGHCMIFRKSAFEQIGGFDERFPFTANDYVFNERLLKHGYNLGLCNHATALHWWNASTKDAQAKGIEPGFITPGSDESFETI